MRTLTMEIQIGRSYQTVYTNKRPVAILVEADPEREETIEEVLVALSEPLTKTLFAACIACAQTLPEVVGVSSEHDTDKEFLTKITLHAPSDANVSFSSAVSVAEVALVAKSLNIKGVDQAALANDIDRIAAATVALVVDLLVANGLSKALPAVATGSEADTLARIAAEARTAWDVAEQIRSAIDDRQQAETTVAQARARLAEVMAAMEPAA